MQHDALNDHTANIDYMHYNTLAVSEKSVTDKSSIITGLIHS